MHKLPFAFCAWLLAATLAGCLSSPPNEPGPSTTTSGSVSSSSSSAHTTTSGMEPGPPPNNPLSMELSQCTGFQAHTDGLPRAIAPGQAPPGWESGSDPTSAANAVSIVSVGGYECNRVHIGPFERGPIRIVFDSHTNADIPARCDQNRTGATHVHILNVLLVSDAELAAYLKGELGLPAVLAEIEVTSRPTGPLLQREWSWNPGGQAPSSILFPDDGNYVDYSITDRFYWARDGGIGQLDFAYDRQGPTLTDREGYGSMQAPMLWSTMPGGQFAGPLVYFPSMDGSGTATLYEDPLCERVEPPV